jgi:hypothetical protein
MSIDTPALSIIVAQDQRLTQGSRTIINVHRTNAIGQAAAPLPQKYYLGDCYTQPFPGET